MTTDPARAERDRLVLAAQRAQDGGRLNEAEGLYRQAVAAQPDDAEALARLGVLLLQVGQAEEGAAVLEQSLAVDPAQPHMLTNRGNALIELGRFDEAIASYERAIALEPEAARPVAYRNMADYLQSLGRDADAQSARDKALALEPGSARAWRAQASELAALGRWAEALALLDQALALRPDDAGALAERGVMLAYLGRPAEAEATYRQALALEPQAFGYESNLALVLQAQGRLTEALAASDRAMALKPDFTQGLVNRAAILHGMGRLKDALADLDRALAIAPDFAEPAANKALLLLLGGDFAQGLPLYEQRWGRRDAPPAPIRERGPPWLGETPLAGKSLLLWADEGLGDTIQMLRYAALAKARGARVIAGVQPSLAELAARAPGVDEVAYGAPEAVAADLHCPTMSLPLAFGTDAGNIPADVPYLSAPEAKTAEWSQRLGPRTRRRIGLVWSGRAGHNNDLNRSIALKSLLPLLTADADYISLQREYRPGDQALMAADGRIRDVSADLESFADTAALIQHLDLAISVDTSVAHLVGAMAKPLYLLLPFAPDHRWMLERSDSPWYPTARLFRQKALGDWSGAFDDLVEALL